ASEGSRAVTDGPGGGGGREEALRIRETASILKPATVVADDDVTVRRIGDQLHHGLRRTAVANRVAQRLANDLRQLVNGGGGKLGVGGRKREIDAQVLADRELGRELVEGGAEVIGLTARAAEHRQVVPHLAVA